MSETQTPQLQNIATFMKHSSASFFLNVDYESTHLLPVMLLDVQLQRVVKRPRASLEDRSVLMGNLRTVLSSVTVTTSSFLLTLF